MAGTKAGGVANWRAASTVLAIAGALYLLIAPPTATAANAGLKPSEAPLVSVGQHYFGNTTHEWNAGCCNKTFDLWRLPPLMAADALTVAWHAESEITRWCIVQNVDDFNWAEHISQAEGDDFQCNGSDVERVAANGNARAVVKARSATASAYLEFIGGGAEYPRGSYDFVIESVQHAIGVSLRRVPRVRPTSTLTASASLSNGTPVPDGLVFTLRARWVTPVNKAVHHRRYRASSQAGRLAFRLKLPHSALHKRVSLVVTRSADTDYLAAKSARYSAKVSRPRRALPSAAASNTKQECFPKLLQPPHNIKAVMYRPGRRPEVVTKASYSGVEGCDSWQRLGKFRVQIKQRGSWANLEGNFWYPTDDDVANKNAAHGVNLGSYATHGVYEHCVKGHWEPARVQFRNYVRNVGTGKIAARGKIKNHAVNIKPSRVC